jgi:broad specificity phosphatase PhoE
MYPEEYAAWERDPVTVAPKGGETGHQVLARALPVMNDSHDLPSAPAPTVPPTAPAVAQA